MRDHAKIWCRLFGRTYDAVNTNGPAASPEECPTNAPGNVVCRFVKGKYNSVLTVAFIGFVGVLVGLFVLLVHPYDVLFKWKNVFGDGGEIYELWRKPPVDLYLKVYLFNVTNAEAFLNGEEKLHVQEVGPYVYKEMLTHENVTFNDNGTLTASPSHPLVWMPELSEGRREDDLLMLPNIALLSIADVVKDAAFFTRFGLNVVIRQTNSQPLVQMTAKEFMFGYRSQLLNLGNSFMPSWIYFDKLGLIDRMYDFDGDYETVYTGETDVSRAGLLDTYRGSPKLPQWEQPCGNIEFASDGTKFPAQIGPDDELKFFRKSMCRAKPLVRINETTTDGFHSYVYTFPDNLDDNGRIDPNNSCYCNDKANCLPVGLLDVRGCYYGFPIALSYPHFYKGDPALSRGVLGTNPVKEKHESLFVIEPSSGLPLKVRVRYQINMALGNVESIANVKEFSNMVLPMLWTEISMNGLPDSLALRFHLYLNVLPHLENVAMYCCFIVGIVCIALAIYRSVMRRSLIEKTSNVHYIDEEMAYIDRKLSYTPEKRASITSKELEVYMSSLVIPLNQEMSFQEFQELKEDNV